jgi:hypothetical protein
VSDLDLYDSEVNELLQMLGKLQVKYGTRRATFENLNAMADEAMNMAEKAGFIITVSVIDETTMQPKLPPEITVHGRVDPELFNFDPEREQWEAKKGIADDTMVKQFLAKGGTKGQAVNIESEVGPSEKQEE